MSSDGGKTCILGDTTKCAGLLAQPVGGDPAPICNATQMRDTTNAFCYRATQALLPNPLDNCEPPCTTQGKDAGLLGPTGVQRRDL
jgi:hypothetical protein